MNKGKSLLKTLDILGYAKIYVADLLESFGCKVTAKDAEFPLYDLEVLAPDGKTISTISVNQDVDIKESGTIAVVVSRRVNGREVPVGLMATKAEYYMIKIYGTSGGYCLETDELMKMYQEKKYKEITVHPDDPDTKVVLFDREMLLERCERIIAK